MAALSDHPPHATANSIASVVATSSSSSCAIPAAGRPSLRTGRGSGAGLGSRSRSPWPGSLVAEIEVVAVPSERQPKYGDSRPDVARNQKARGRKKQRNGGGPVPVACKARQHQGKGGARHHHPANRSGDFLLVNSINPEPAPGPECAGCRSAPTVATVAGARYQAPSSLDTCTGCQAERPAGVRTPRASSTLATPASVSTPEWRISSTTTFVVALARARLTVLAALALAAVSALPAVPSLVPRALPRPTPRGRARALGGPSMMVHHQRQVRLRR
jgi:hypothetical protein